MKQLAVSVASHDDILTAGCLAAAPAAPSASPSSRSHGRSSPSGPNGGSANAGPPSRREPEADAVCRRSADFAAVKTAIDDNRLDIYLQPMVTLPQRKVRFYEAVTRMRDEHDQMLAADEFVGIVEGDRTDRARRSHRDAALRAGAAAVDGAQQGCRRFLQRRRSDAAAITRPSRTSSTSSKPTVRWHRHSSSSSSRRYSAISARPRPSISRHWPSAATASRSTRHRLADRAARAGRPRRSLHQGAGRAAARSQALVDVGHSHLRPLGLARPFRHRSDSRADRR